MSSDHSSPSCESVLFATHPIVQTSTPPVIVVGLPRSGSSFLAYVLGNLDGWYVFDDLYIYQNVQALNIKGVMTQEQREKLLYQLAWSLRARIKFENNFFKPQLTWEDVDKMETAILEAFKEHPLQWPQLLEEWMMRLSIHHGCSRWGYKTPQDFMHMNQLEEIFPGTRFIFIMRDPRKMMLSKKYVHQQDGNPNEYHPIAYALYWKMAYEKVQEFIKDQKAHVFICKFEKLVKSPDTVGSQLADFLGTTISGEIATKGKNTSFASKKQKTITNTEIWICQKLAGNQMQEAGYQLNQVSPTFQDLPDLLGTSYRFIQFQFNRILKDKKKQHSVKSFLGNLLGKK